MSTVSVLLTRRQALGSLVIRTWRHSAFSHCALVDGDRVIEAVLRDGVREGPLDDAQAHASHSALIEVRCPRPDLAIKAARDQIGKRYDWKAPLGVGLRYDMHDSERWDCVELVAWAIAQGGRQLFRDDKYHRLHPHDLYLPLFD